MHYDRKIKYLELVERGQVLQNAGFVKLEAREGKVSLRVNAEKLKDTDGDMLQVLLLGDEKEALFGEIRTEQGRACVSYEGLDFENLAEGITYEELQEIQIRLQGSRMLRCVIKEGRKDRPLILKEEPDVEAVSMPIQTRERKGIVLETQPEEEKQAETFATEPSVEQHEETIEKEQQPNPAKSPASTKWQQLWESYPHITPFDDHREYLELKPEDLVVLSRECYPLISNSFLLHGFYNYKHLILTKEMTRGQEQYYIGAPGNFYTKEKQVAVLFGFESFEGKAEPAQNGDFGYYMIPVEI